LDEPFHQIFQIGFLWRVVEVGIEEGLGIENREDCYDLGRMVRRRIWSLLGII